MTALRPIPDAGITCDQCGETLLLVRGRDGLDAACPTHGTATWMARPRPTPIAATGGATA